jgi:glycosyltransferase involved in cell wall biosynthesis
VTASNHKIKVGRIVTTYGHWGQIDRWLSDLTLLQPHVRWVFVNDKPEDPLPEKMKARVSRFGTVIEPKVNLGRCCARNLGVQSLDTEWVDIIDGDDYPYPIDENFDSIATGCGFIYFDVNHHKFSGTEMTAVLDEQWQPPHLNRILYELVGNYDPRPISVMWRRSVFNSLGGFDGRTDYVEDFNLVMRAILSGYKYTKTLQRKGSYQVATPNRLSPPIEAVANLHNWELARKLATAEILGDVEAQIDFWRKATLWIGMREYAKSKPHIISKIRETIKWWLGMHSN